MLELEGVHAHYGLSHVLQGVSLAIGKIEGKGEVVGVFGRNGVGKTTLVKTVAGWVKPTSGSIRFEGIDIAGLASDRICRHGIGLVPEDRRVFPGLSVEENLRLGLMQSPGRSRAECDRVVDRIFGRFARLAGDLLLIARSDRGQIPLRLERIDVTDLLRSTVSRFEWRSDEEGRPLHAEPATGIYVHGDRLRLEQALGNLVDNALRHGQGAVRLSAEGRNGQVELHVTDQGRGIQSEFLVHAFERFTRAESARSRSGSGLGLAIVQAIASAHQGTARLANTHPHGLDAWLTLPQDGFAS